MRINQTLTSRTEIYSFSRDRYTKRLKEVDQILSRLLLQVYLLYEEVNQI